MSLLLGIETATVSVSVAIVRDGITLGSFECPGARRQTETLHPALELLFRATGIAPSDLDAVVVDIGPGRFTGVRVGVAAAKGLAFGAEIGVVGCSSTEILLESVRSSGEEAVAVVDLRRGEVAVRFSGDDPDLGTFRTTPGELGHMLATHAWTGALLVGDGAREYESQIAEGAGAAVRVGGPEFASPTATAACAFVQRGDHSAVAIDPAALEAVYLRGADVRLGWATRGRRQRRHGERSAEMALRWRRSKDSEPESVVIGPMTRRHVPELLGIESRIFPRPWTASLYYSELAQPDTRIYLVATVDGAIVGYIGCMLVLEEGHITTVGVSPDWHRRGIATRLLHAAITTAIDRGVTALTLEVRMTNEGAQDLYRAFGFVPAGIRKNYYPEVNEDGLVMWASDVNLPQYRARIDSLVAKVASTGLDRRDETRADG